MTRTVALVVAAKQVAMPSFTTANGHAPKPHSEECPQAEYLARQEMLFAWNKQRYSEWDYTDRGFWRVYGEKSVPSCTCPWRKIASNGHVELPMRQSPNGHSNDHFLLSDGPTSGYILNRLQSRLQTMLVAITGNTEFAFMEMGSLDGQNPGLERHVAPTAHSVLERLRQWELFERRSARHR